MKIRHSTRHAVAILAVIMLIAFAGNAFALGDDPDCSDVWAHTWARVDEPETQLIITRNGDGSLHMEAFFYRMVGGIEANFRPDGSETASFVDVDGAFAGSLWMDSNAGGLLHLYMNGGSEMAEDSLFYDYFMNGDFVFSASQTSDEWDEDQAWEDCWDDDWDEDRDSDWYMDWEWDSYPEPPGGRDWEGHWAMIGGDFESHIYITGDAYDAATMTVSFDGLYTFSGIIIPMTDYTLEFYADEFNALMEINRENHTLLLYEIGTTVDYVNDWLDFFHFQVIYDLQAQPVFRKASIAYQSNPYRRQDVYFNTDMFMKDTYSYHKDISLLSIVLSTAAYDSSEEYAGDNIVCAYNDLGIPDDNIMLFNYCGHPLNTPGFEEKNHKQFSIASCDMGNYELLLIVLRGTGLGGDDVKIDLDVDYETDMKVWIHGGFYNYMQTVKRGLQVYLNRNPLIQSAMTDKKLKVLITGHSLGGAAANLLGAYLTSKEYQKPWVGTADMYVYTYASPRVFNTLRKEKPTTTSCAYIFNIVIDKDPVPTQPPDRSWYRFGTTYVFKTSYNSPASWLNPADDHEMQNYLNVVLDQEPIETDIEYWFGIVTSNAT